VSREFESYPAPSDVFWLLDTPKDPRYKLDRGEELPRFSAGKMKNLGNNRLSNLNKVIHGLDFRYEVSLTIKKAAKWDDSHSHKLVVTVSPEENGEVKTVN